MRELACKRGSKHMLRVFSPKGTMDAIENTKYMHASMSYIF